MRDRVPTLAISGHGRCGKDTAGEWLGKHTTLHFEGGCSWAARYYMAERLSEEAGRFISPFEAYQHRHRDRMKWYNWLNDLRKDDPAKLVRLVLQTSDFVCGIRDVAEFRAARNEGLIDLAVWIERPGIEIDPTLTYTRDDCDIVIYNDSDLETYLGRWKRLCAALGVLKGVA